MTSKPAFSSLSVCRDEDRVHLADWRTSTYIPRHVVPSARSMSHGRVASRMQDMGVDPHVVVIAPMESSQSLSQMLSPQLSNYFSRGTRTGPSHWAC